MAYSQYSEHRRPPAVPKVGKVTGHDATGEGELKQRQDYQKAVARLAGDVKPPAGKKSFADALKHKK